MTTFICDKGDYAIETLLQFSKDKNILIVIRGFGVIEDGELFRQNISEKISGEINYVQ